MWTRWILSSSVEMNSMAVRESLGRPPDRTWSNGRVERPHACHRKTREGKTLTLLRKAVERNHYLTLAFYILSFFLTVFFLGKVFDIGSGLALRIILFYVVVFFLVSSMLNWMFYFFAGREDLARYLETILHQFYEGMQDGYKRNMGNLRNTIETSVDDRRLSPEFRQTLTGIWARMEQATFQQNVMNEISWKRALRRYARQHPGRFSKDTETDGEFTFVKGEDTERQGDTVP